MTGVVTREEPVATSGISTPVTPPRHAGASRPPSLDTLFTLLFALAGWILGFRQLGDNSFLWHLRTGRLILANGVPHADPYSFTVPGAKWIAQSWLAELAYGVADKAAGGFGVRVLVALTASAFVVGAYRLALRVSGNRVRAAGLMTVVLATMLNVWSERPLLFGLAAIVALVWAVEVPESFLGRHLMISIPVTMWCWANVHGSFELGYVYLALHVIGRWADGDRPTTGRERQLVIATLVSVAALLVNPYGFGLVLFPIDLLRRGSVLNTVSEWQSPNFRELGGMIYGLWLGAVVLLLVHRKPSRRDLIVTLPFLFLGLWAIRNVGIAALVTLPVAGRAWVGGRTRDDARLRLGWAFVGLFVLCGAMRLSAAASEPDFDLHKYPVAAMHQLDRRGLLGARLYTTDAWAGYTIWRYWPQQHVFMDDRYDMYPKSVVDDYDTIANVSPKWSATLDRWRIDVVLWPRQRSLSQVLAEDTNWSRVYADKTAVVFVRNHATN
ncbi:MAG: hypothetical protein JWL83_662 [Actinomycetia bacterium]|nr:hypothetical protein [Actinomycetes bacterium]